MKEWQAHLAVAVEAAQIAGRYQRYRFNSDVTVDLKGDKDLVTEVDRESEHLIVNHLLARFPNYNILAEEGEYAPTDSPLRWIIDPVDGTTNYAHGFPWFCVSIGLESDGILVAGVVFNPMQEELFTTTKGGGAYLNGSRLSVSNRSPLKNSLLGTGFPYDCATDSANNFSNFIAFQKAARGIRRAGAAALDLAYVAAGRLDGFWELKLKPWDVAAGVLLIEEAGGTVSTFDGKPFSISNNRVVASNSLIHGEMLTILQSVNQEGPA
ncbi:MAG TPA: inositol monophosphatase family protein [Desulfuromonadaceae bacterium]